MIFASFEFLFLFLPAFFAAYFLTPARWRNYTILLLSWGFYAWWRVDFLALLVGVTLFTWLCALAMEGAGERTRNRLLVLGLVGDLGVLGYFKYANFGVQTFNDVVTAFGGTRRSSQGESSASEACTAALNESSTGWAKRTRTRITPPPAGRGTDRSSAWRSRSSDLPRQPSCPG